MELLSLTYVVGFVIAFVATTGLMLFDALGGFSATGDNPNFRWSKMFLFVFIGFGVAFSWPMILGIIIVGYLTNLTFRIGEKND